MRALQEPDGYVKELGRVRSLKTKQYGMNVELSWEDMIEEENKGFLLGYIVSYKHPSDDQNEDGDKKESLIVGPSVRMHMLSNLHPGYYIFKVKAFTSAGEGPGSLFYTLVLSILTALGTLASVITIIVLYCSKREWGFTHIMDKILLAERETLMVKNSEPCPQGELQLLKAHKEVGLKSKEPRWTRYYNDVCDSVSPVSIDPSCTEVPSPGIQNSTYNIPLSLPDDANLELGYVPQIQNVDNQLQPCDVKFVQMDSAGYQPQSQGSSQTTEIPNETSLPLNTASVSSSEYLLSMCL
ncbi:hypothetical protein AOLI_G00208340 [Acnodon oligacanthus]